MSDLIEGDTPTSCAEQAARSDVTVLVSEARAGDPSAWEHLIAQYQPLVTSITRRYRLSDADAADIGQTVWLKLFEHLAGLRESRALPGWILTTTTRACLHVLSAARRTVSVDALNTWSWNEAPSTSRVGDETRDQGDVCDHIFRSDCYLAVLRGLAELAPHEQDLLVLLLTADPPLSYRQISERLELPIGSIGPQRARYLQKLRRTRAVERLGLAVENIDAAA